MPDFYRGSTPTFRITPMTDISRADYVEVVFLQSRVTVVAESEMDFTSNTITAWLTNSQTAEFDTEADVEMQARVIISGVKVLARSAMLTVGENRYEFQQTTPSPVDELMTFKALDFDSDDDPTEYGAYELVDDEYVLTSDTEPNEDKVYYLDLDSLYSYFPKNNVIYGPYGLQYIEVSTEERSMTGIIPALESWYELEDDDSFSLTMDRTVDNTTVYYKAVDPDFDRPEYEDEYNLFAKEIDAEDFMAYMGSTPIDDMEFDDSDEDAWDEGEDFDLYEIDDEAIAYTAVTSPGTNPSQEGYFEYGREDEDEESYYYPTNDETVVSGKTYYMIA